MSGLFLSRNRLSELMGLAVGESFLFGLFTGCKTTATTEVKADIFAP